MTRYLILVGIVLALAACGAESEPPTGPPAEASVGDTWTRPADGAVMVFVPAGEFLMGSEDTDPDAEDDEKPQHTVDLIAYWIDRTEVTNARYNECVEAGSCEETRCPEDSDFNSPDQPVVCVNWQQVSVGIAAAGKNVDVWVTDEVLQFFDGDQLLRTEKRTTNGPVRKKRASVPTGAAVES